MERAMSRKAKAFWITVLLGAILAVAVAESNWLMAAIIGALFVATLWIFVHAYPRDAAPPADRRHENTQRRRAGLKP
jgi:uncharacterized membrane protein